MRLGRRRALDDEPPQRLAQLEARRGAGLVAERDDAAHLSDLGEQLLVRLRRLRPAGEVDRTVRPVAHERLPQVLGEERQDRRDNAQRLDEREPERPQRRLVAVPEPAPRAADVPVREIVDERLEARITSTVSYAS